MILPAMNEQIICKICGKRRAKRACPAVQGNICALCCGTERENTLACPLSCQYLQEAHSREKTIAVPEDQLSNLDIEVTEEFVAAHEELVLFSVYSLLQSALRTTGAFDSDILEALSGLIQTYRTLQSGLVYETVSSNPIAATIQRGFSASMADYQRLRAERESLAPVRDSEILASVVFLHRVGQQNQNGRPKGRMFIDLLRHMTPDTPVDERAPSLII